MRVLNIYYVPTRPRAPKARPPYPPNTKAFLYYFTPPERPRIAGELRLRVASSDDPASFESGSDLLLPNGRPWSRPLYCLSNYYLPLYKKLREDQLVPDDLDTALSAMPPEYPLYYRNHILYTLNDSFILDFSAPGPFFLVMTQKGKQRLAWLGRFVDQREICKSAPYTGAYTNHLSHSYTDYYRKCLGSV